MKNRSYFIAAAVAASWAVFCFPVLPIAHADDVSVSAPSSAVQVTFPPGDGALLTTNESLGVNTAAWDGEFLDSSIPSLLKDAGIGLVRYPGGSWADGYHWQTDTHEMSGDWVNSMNFDQFMSVVDASNAKGVVTVNYGSGTPQEASAWVQYAKDKNYNVSYWEVGNENYGTWEIDKHTDPHTGTSYATNALPFIQQMKAANPSIQIGVPVNIGWTSDPHWNDEVLSQLGSKIDYLDYHWYPFWTADMKQDDVFASLHQIPSIMSQLNDLTTKYNPKAYVMVTEMNVSSAANRYNQQPVGALFAASATLNWLAAGARTADWWDAHNFGSPDADFGIFSSGSNGEPATDTPMPPYYGIKLASLLTAAQGHLVKLTTSDQNVEAFASKTDKGMSIMLINEDTTNQKSVTLSVPIDHRTVQATEYTYSTDNPEIVMDKALLSVDKSSDVSENVAPGSITVFTIDNPSVVNH